MAEEQQQQRQPLLAHDHHHHGGQHHAHADEAAEQERLKQQALADIKALDIKYTEILKSWSAQGHMAWPVLLQLVAMYALSIISLSFVGHIGKQELAAAALGTSFVNVLARMVIMGLNGAMDTLAAQAVGGGDLDALHTLFYRNIVFLWVHAIPLTVGLLYIPKFLASQGSDPDMAARAFSYLAFLIPNIWLDCLIRPLNSALVSQRITRPQMVAALVVLPAHIGTNWLLIYKLGLGYIGAAIANCMTTAYTFILINLILLASGSLGRVWGTIRPRNIMKGWKLHASIAYPACFMRCAESLGFSLVTLSSGLLPDPETAVAAASVAFNLYGVFFMGFTSFATTVVAFIGNALGTGDVRQARVTAIASILMSPLIWCVVAFILLEPHTQHWLVLLFNDGTDEALMFHLKKLLIIVAVLEFFDGTQTIMSGIITGSGKQKYGAWINLGAFYFCAIPLAMFLGFKMNLGVEGMYWGMATGPFTQCVAYCVVVFTTNWQKEANKVQERLAAARGQ